ncbi:MAG: hypothetical protein ACRDT4_14645 [Micromonosporaceae bacterium]
MQQPDSWRSAALPPVRPKIRVPWPVWLLVGTIVVSFCMGVMGPPIALIAAGASSPARGSDEPENAPDDLCAVIDKDALAYAVPAPSVTRSEADNDYNYTRYAYCDVETDEDAATSTARASLYVELERHGAFLDDSAPMHAREEFAWSKEYELDHGEGVLDIEGVGDSAWVVFDSDTGDGDAAVELEVLVGADTLNLHYLSSPATNDMALAAVVTVAKSLVKGLKR